MRAPWGCNNGDRLILRQASRDAKRNTRPLPRPDAGGAMASHHAADGRGKPTGNTGSGARAGHQTVGGRG